MTAFTTATAFGNRIQRTFTGGEASWITELLEDASAFLRSEIGQDLYPRTTSTYTAYPTNGEEVLPQAPIVAVTAVIRDGHDIPYTYQPGRVLVDGDEPCDITFTWGYAEAPRELQRVTSVLVSQTLLPLEAKLGLTAGGLSSAQIDEFRLAWADAGDQSGMALPERLLNRLRAQYGRAGVHIAETGR